MKWTLDDSRLVYGVSKADLHFLDIDSKGHLLITLNGQHIALTEVIRQIGTQVRAQGYPRIPSFRLRIPQLIDSQVEKVSGIFFQVMEEQGYQGKFQIMYPIKVNAAKSLILQILSNNTSNGLAIGTKPELVKALKELKKKKSRLIVCSGVKDLEYIEIVRQALEEGYNLWISLESIKEAQFLLTRLPRDKIQVALRIKPYVSIMSHWGASAGRHSKFGLSIQNLDHIVKLLKQEQAEHTVVAIHAHPGSQVLNNIYAFAEYVAQAYIHLHDAGFSNLTTINLGGGLPINYNGHLAPGSVQANVMAIIVAFIKTLGEDYSHPNIITESGRIITALHELLAVRVFEKRHIFPKAHTKDLKESTELNHLLTEAKKAQDARTILQIWKYWLDLSDNHNSLSDIYQYEKLTGALKTQLRLLFVKLENYETYLNNPYAIELLRPEYIAQGTFSVFNGVCDHVLVGQYFPVLPITHLHHQPRTLVRLVDLTCDSDGEISNYHPPINDRRLYTKDGYPLTTTRKHNLIGFPVGDVKSLEDNFLIIALVGAYQELIKMDPNLIGDLPNAQLTLTPRGKWETKWRGATQTIQNLVDQTRYTLPQLDDPYID